MQTIYPPINGLELEEFAVKKGFGLSDFNIGDVVRHISFWFSDNKVTQYDLYKIESGVVIKKNKEYDIQVYENNKPSGYWLSVGKWQLSI